MIIEIITRGYFVNVVELRGPIKREHHHDVIDSFKKRGLLRVLKLNQLQLSDHKYQDEVRNFVIAERESLRARILELI